MQDYEESIAQMREAEEQDHEESPLRSYDDVATERISELLRGVGDAVRTPIDRYRIERAKLLAIELKEQLNLLGTMKIYD